MHNQSELSLPAGWSDLTDHEREDAQQAFAEGSRWEMLQHEACDTRKELRRLLVAWERCGETALQTPGYDRETGLYLAFAADAFPAVPDAPTKDECELALQKLERPFRAFRFATPAGSSVPLAAILTGLARTALRTAPMFVVDAPVAGSGKSILLETIGLIVLGHTIPSLSQGKEDSEDEKRLSSALMRGDRAILIDNCDRPIGGDFLCSMITQSRVESRVLSRSQMLVLGTDVLVLANGNNVAFAGDTARRSIVCRIDQRVERPDESKFGFDPRDEARADRAALVVAERTPRERTLLHTPHLVFSAASFASRAREPSLEPRRGIYQHATFAYARLISGQFGWRR